MKAREKTILELRPIVLFDSKKQFNEHELFQNNTLRPVLKFQNQLILMTFKNAISRRINHFKTLPHDQLLITIKNELANNQQLRNMLIGMVIGLFSASELTFYLNNEREAKKRIIALLIERIFSQFHLL